MSQQKPTLENEHKSRRVLFVHQKVKMSLFNLRAAPIRHIVYNKPPSSRSVPKKGGVFTVIIKSQNRQNFRRLRRRFWPIYIGYNYTYKTSFLSFLAPQANFLAFVHRFWGILQSKMMIFKGKAEIHLKFFAGSQSQNLRSEHKKGGVYYKGGGLL